MSARMLIGQLTVLLLLIFTCSTDAYEILLDIDNDNDPATINELSLDSTVVVKVVLQPSQPGELVTDIFFGLGGACWECDGVQDYGISHDMYPPDFGDWTEHPQFVGTWDSATHLGCSGDPGFHDVYFATAVGGGLQLDEPVFIASFTAWVDEPMWGWCPRPPRSLAAFHSQGDDGYWNRIQIGGVVVSTSESDWGMVKSLFK